MWHVDVYASGGKLFGGGPLGASQIMWTKEKVFNISTAFMCIAYCHEIGVCGCMYSEHKCGIEILLFRNRQRSINTIQQRNPVNRQKLGGGVTSVRVERCPRLSGLVKWFPRRSQEMEWRPTSRREWKRRLWGGQGGPGIPPGSVTVTGSGTRSAFSACSGNSRTEAALSDSGMVSSAQAALPARRGSALDQNIKRVSLGSSALNSSGSLRQGYCCLQRIRAHWWAGPVSRESIIPVGFGSSRLSW